MLGDRDALHQFAQTDLQSDGDPSDVGEAYIALATLDRAHESAVHAA